MAASSATPEQKKSVLLSWTAPEFEYRAKGVGWYWKTIILASIIIAFSIWQGNVVFAGFIVIAEIMIIIWGNRAPEAIHFSITRHGIAIGQRMFFLYPALEAFSITVSADPLSGWDELVIHPKYGLAQRVRVRIPKNLTPSVHRILSIVVAEIEHEDTLVDVIQHYLGF